MRHSLSIIICGFILLGSQWAAHSQSFVCLSQKGTEIAATVYSEKLEEERTVLIQTHVTEFPENAVLSPDKTMIALVYARDFRKKQEGKMLLAELESGWVRTTLSIPFEAILRGGEWRDADMFHYQTYFPSGNSYVRNLVQIDKFSGKTETIKSTSGEMIPTEYRQRAEKGAKWFDQLKISPPYVLHSGGGEPFLSQMGWFHGTGLGAVSKDGNTAVIVTSSANRNKVNDLLVVVSKGRLLGTLTLPINLKNAELKIVGNFLILQGIQNKKSCVLVWRLLGLQFVGRLDERLVVDE